MPQLELTDRELVVHLGKWEQLLALHPSLRIPLDNVRGATEDRGFGGIGGLKLGWRLPGTHIPFLLAAGTYIRDGDRQFVYTRCRRQTIVIELAHKEWTRIVLGVPDARVAATNINAAVARFKGLT